jgi:hypothetical protein
MHPICGQGVRSGLGPLSCPCPDRLGTRLVYASLVPRPVTLSASRDVCGMAIGASVKVQRESKYVASLLPGHAPRLAGHETMTKVPSTVHVHVHVQY